MTPLLTTGLPGSLADMDPTTLLAVAGVVLLLLWSRARRRARRRPTRRTRTTAAPQVGQMWWADVPFEGGTGSKDRPCVVVETHGSRAVVLYVTSTDKTGRPGWLVVPRRGWSPSAGTSWLRTDRRITLDADRFRRYAGPCPPAVRKALGF